MKSLLFILLGCCLGSGLAQAAGDAAALTRTGQAMPGFTVTTLDGKVIGPGQMKGRVVLVNFFATWCPPCMLEMPRLEKEIWGVFKNDKKFLMVSIAREQSETDVKQFLQKTPYTFSFAADPKRGVYSKFATQGIPRNYLVNAAGRIVFQSEGYDAKDFDLLAKAIKKELAK